MFDNDFTDDAEHTKRFNLKVDEEKMSLTRDPFSKASAKTKICGPLAWPLSHLKLIWLVGSRLTKRPDWGPLSRRFPADLAERVRSCCEDNGIPGVSMKKQERGLAKMHFPVMSANTLSSEALDKLWVILRDFNLSAGNDNHQPVAEAGYAAARDSESVKLTLQYLGCVARLLEEKNIDLSVVYQPSLPLISDTNRRLFSEWCEENRIPFLSLREPLRQVSLSSEKAVFYPIDGHLAAYGHSVIGRKIYEWISPARQQQVGKDGSPLLR